MLFLFFLLKGILFFESKLLCNSSYLRFYIGIMKVLLVLVDMLFVSDIV